MDTGSKTYFPLCTRYQTLCNYNKIDKKETVNSFSSHLIRLRPISRFGLLDSNYSFKDFKICQIFSQKASIYFCTMRQKVKLDRCRVWTSNIQTASVLLLLTEQCYHFFYLKLKEIFFSKGSFKYVTKYRHSIPP